MGPRSPKQRIEPDRRPEELPEPTLRLLPTRPPPLPPAPSGGFPPGSWGRVPHGLADAEGGGLWLRGVEEGAELAEVDAVLAVVVVTVAGGPAATAVSGGRLADRAPRCRLARVAGERLADQAFKACFGEVGRHVTRAGCALRRLGRGAPPRCPGRSLRCRAEPWTNPLTAARRHRLATGPDSVGGAGSGRLSPERRTRRAPPDRATRRCPSGTSPSPPACPRSARAGICLRNGAGMP